VLLTLLTPVLAVTAVAVLLAMGRPILFRQSRPGRHGDLFELVKFRTMLAGNGDEVPADDGRRLTRAGTLLRAASLDELPTLWNVLRGDMSLVGPRPLLVSYLDRYSPEQARRHEVRPGVTGLAQVRGRNALSWDEKFRYDVRYVDERSLSLDARILIETPWALLHRKGINAHGHATMPEFRPDGPGDGRRSRV
jgi:lipopolysaccharide/colanic/teichoic acid biosynthesis glycosyltransferase